MRRATHRSTVEQVGVYMVTDLQADQQTRVLRYVLCDVHHQVDSYSLIGSCDTSKKAYAAVVYLRVKTQEGFHVKFLTSKMRVIPLRGFEYLKKLNNNCTKLHCAVTVSLCGHFIAFFIR